MSRKRLYTILIPALVLIPMLAFLFFLTRALPNRPDQAFESFTDELFCQEVAGNTLTLHYTLQNPASYRIRDPEISLGSFPTDMAAANARTENLLARLHNLPYQRLCPDNQRTYRVLEDALNQSLTGTSYLLYEEPLRPLTGIQTQLPILLSEYQFYRSADVDTYLKLLGTMPDYMNSLIAFENAKSDAGLFMSTRSADAIIRECNSFVDLGDENCLYTSFEGRLSTLEDCSRQEKDTYIETNRRLLTDSIFPAYRQLIDALTKLRSTGKHDNGLCQLPEGAAYYEYLVREATGSGRTVPELESLIRHQMKDDLVEMQKIFAAIACEQGGRSDGDMGEFFSEFALEDPEPDAILADLSAKITGSFPAIPKTTTQIKEVQPEMAEYLSPAFYMVPALDNAGGQTIYINSAHLPDDLRLYTTLAHEGYPGHLYQNVYYASTDPAPIRSLLGCGGYTEGWATYVEMLSYYLSGLPKVQASLYQHNASLLLGLYALADIGIHYEGWTRTDAVAFFRDYGISDAGTIQEIYDLIIADPANYLKYYIGYVEFLELKKQAIEEWGEEFSQKRFHQAVLEAGPMPFYLLQEELFDGE